MEKIFISILVSMLKRILTERLLSRLVVYVAWFLSQLTTNKLDDKGVEALAEALGVKDYK